MEIDKYKSNIPTNVFIHGWGTTSKTWERTCNELTDYKIAYINMKLPGFELDEPTSGWGVKEYAEYTMDYLKTNNIKPPYNFIGHSFGGRICIYIAANYPEVVNKLVLKNAAGAAERNELKVKMFQSLLIKNVRKIAEKLMPAIIFTYSRALYIKVLGSPNYKSASQVMKETLKQVVNYDLTPLLNKINADTLIVWGEIDNVTPLSEGKKLHEGIKGSKLVVIKDAGHHLHLTHYEQWINELIPFIN